MGGVGEALAVMLQDKPWIAGAVLADYNLDRARQVQQKLGNPDRFPIAFINAKDKDAIVALAKEKKSNFIMNAVDPQFNPEIFDAALLADCDYMDMATTLSKPDPDDPFNKVGVKLGEYQFAQAHLWEQANRLAVVGAGVEPGMVDVFARYVIDSDLFDVIEEMGVRDGSNIVIDGYDFAPNFSIWTTIEECLNPPVVWEDGAWHTTRPFSGKEKFVFPGGIGPQWIVNVEHEEAYLIPIGLQKVMKKQPRKYAKKKELFPKRVTFKYALGDQFIHVLETLHMLGLDSTKKVNVKGVEVSPRDVVAACLPNPALLGDKMHGKTCAGLWVKGMKNGKPREIYIHQIADNEKCMREFGCQAVVAQTAFTPAIILELLAKGIWKDVGVLGPEAFDPKPFMKRMPKYGFRFEIVEMKNGIPI